jgi:6-pyruvoyltetrahydropterin/6-carboxytetrahydropterin synthase
MKPTVEITKEVSFEAAHYLHNARWSREKNLAIFKRCSGYRLDEPKASGLPHGHSYRVVVALEGPVGPDTGFVMDFRILKDILDKEVRDRLDHKFLNVEVSPFKDKGVIPSAENIAVVIWDRIAPVLKKEKVKLLRVEVWESPGSGAIYKGHRK